MSELGICWYLLRVFVCKALSLPKDDKRSIGGRSERAYLKKLKSSLIINRYGCGQTIDIGCYHKA